MKDPRLRRKLADFEYERRSNQLMLPFVFALLPPVALGLVTYLQFGVVSWAGVSIAAATCTLVILYGGHVAGKAAVNSLKSEGLADEDYQPPPI